MLPEKRGGGGGGGVRIEVCAYSSTDLGQVAWYFLHVCHFTSKFLYPIMTNLSFMPAVF